MWSEVGPMGGERAPWLELAQRGTIVSGPVGLPSLPLHRDLITLGSALP